MGLSWQKESMVVEVPGEVLYPSVAERHCVHLLDVYVKFLLLYYTLHNNQVLYIQKNSFCREELSWTSIKGKEERISKAKTLTSHCRTHTFYFEQALWVYRL